MRPNARFSRNLAPPLSLFWETGRQAMTDKFDPAPHDKHAVHPHDAIKADKIAREDLKAGLIGTFPASDPVSATQPAPSLADSRAENASFWDRFTAIFR